MTSPIIETNIERILEDHLWSEVSLIESRIADLTAEINSLFERKEKLIRIAEAAELSTPEKES